MTRPSIRGELLAAARAIRADTTCRQLLAERVAYDGGYESLARDVLLLKFNQTSEAFMATVEKGVAPFGGRHRAAIDFVVCEKEPEVLTASWAGLSPLQALDYGRAFIEIKATTAANGYYACCGRAAGKALLHDVRHKLDRIRAEAGNRCLDEAKEFFALAFLASHYWEHDLERLEPHGLLGQCKRNLLQGLCDPDDPPCELEVAFETILHGEPMPSEPAVRVFAEVVVVKVS